MYIGDNASLKCLGTSLTVFGQSENTGRLEIRTSQSNAILVPDYIQNGGTVEVYNTNSSVSCYGLYTDKWEMNGGNLTAYGAYGGINASNHAELNGGVVNARGGQGGIIFSKRSYSVDANINLNGTILNISGYDHVNLGNGISGQFTMTPGMTYIDDNRNIYQGNNTNEVNNIPSNTSIYPNGTHDIKITSTGGNENNYAFSTSNKAFKGDEVEIIVRLENYNPTDNSIMVKSVTVNGEKIASRNGHYKFAMPYETANVNVEFAQYTIVPDKNETCTETGVLWHLVDSEGNCYRDVFGTPMDNVIVPAKGHQWISSVDYTWEQVGDDWYCTASQQCRECHETITETVKAESRVTKEPTADELGILLYTAEFETDGFETQYKRVDLDTVEPEFGEPEYTWEWSETDNTYIVTAVKHCTNGGAWLDITDEAKAYIQEQNFATCVEGSGYKIYQANFNEPFETQSRTVRTTNPDNHHGIRIWLTFDWETHTGKATVTCDGCGHTLVQDAEATVTQSEKLPTETENGKIIYTVAYTYNGIPASHSFIEAVPATNCVAKVENTISDDEKGVTGYNDLTDALIDANGDTPVVLCKDISIDYYDNDAHIGWQVIDLNGHTLTINNLCASKHLEVRNGTLNCKFSDYGCNTLILDNATLNFTEPEIDENGNWENYSTWESANLILRNGSTLNIRGYFSMFDYAYPYDGFNLDIDNTSKIVFDSVLIYAWVMDPEYSELQFIIERYFPDGYCIAFDGTTYFIADNNGHITETVELHRPNTVTWRNYDGTLLETDENVPYDSMPSYDGETSERQGNAQYSYEFKGWNKEFSPVTEDVTYSAVFEETVNKYTVIWKNPDGTDFKTETLDYGTALSSGLSLPYGYNSLYWHDENYNRYLDNELPVLTKNVTYTAEFSAVKTLRADTVFYTGDEVDFNDKYFISNPIMNWSNNISDVQYINITYNSFFGQYTVGEGFFPILAVNSPDYGSRNDIGIRVAGGDGSYENPYTFEMALPDIDCTVIWINGDETTTTLVKLGDTPSNDSYEYWSDGQNTYTNDTFPVVTTDDIIYTADTDLKTLAVGTVFRAGDRVNFAEYYIRSDEDNCDYFSTNYAQGIHTINELRYNSELGKYEIISSQDLFPGNKLDIAHVKSAYYNDYDIGIKVISGTGSENNPFILAIDDVPTTTHTVTWVQNGTTLETDENVTFGSQAKFDGQADVPDDSVLYWSDGINLYRSDKLPLVTSILHISGRTISAIMNSVYRYQAEMVLSTDRSPLQPYSQM